MLQPYTLTGSSLIYPGESLTLNSRHYCCVTAAFLLSHGFHPYVTRAEDGEDGVYDGEYVHFTGAPYVAPEPTPYVPTEAELAAQAEAQRIANIQSEIAAEKDALSATDYIITKCMEAQILGNDLPYDASYLDSIHAERQAHRDRINELEAELNAEN